MIEKGSQIGSAIRGYPSDVNKESDFDVIGASKQDELCTVCCRDHHDADGYPAYRPYIGNITGNHPHYKADGTVAVAGDTYVEACRVQRVDGFWRVTPDWLLIDLSVIPCNYFSTVNDGSCPPTGTPDSTKLINYSNRIQQMLGQFSSAIQSVSATGSSLATFSHGVSPLLSKDVVADYQIVENGGSLQLVSRGLYADVIFKPQVNGKNPREIDTVYGAYLATLNAADQPSFLRFYDANLTLLSSWAPSSTADGGSKAIGSCSVNTPSADPVCVTSNPVKTISTTGSTYYNNTYSRGKLVGRAASGSNVITASMPRGNTGLTNSSSIDGVSGAPVMTSQVRAVIDNATGDSGIFGAVFRANTSVNFYSTSSASSVVITATNGVTCRADDPAGLGASSSSFTYTCNLPSGVTTTTLTFTGPSNYRFRQEGVTSAPTVSATIAVSSLGEVPNMIAYNLPRRIIGSIEETGKGDANKVQVFATGWTCSKPTKTTYSCESSATDPVNATLTATTSQNGASVTPSSASVSGVWEDVTTTTNPASPTFSVNQ